MDMCWWLSPAPPPALLGRHSDGVSSERRSSVTSPFFNWGMCATLEAECAPRGLSEKDLSSSVYSLQRGIQLAALRSDNSNSARKQRITATMPVVW